MRICAYLFLKNVGKSSEPSDCRKCELSSAAATSVCSFLVLKSCSTLRLHHIFTPMQPSSTTSSPHPAAIFLHFLLFILWSDYLQVHSDKFPLSPFSLLYPGAFCFCWLFSKLRILTFLPRGPLWQQPLIFLSLVCCIKIAKGVVSESVNPVIYDDCSGSSLAGRIEQNTSIPRETKS